MFQPFITANQIIRSAEVERVMLRVDRGKYSKNNPYMDSPQGIGFGVTISAPHMVRHALLLNQDHCNVSIHHCKRYDVIKCDYYTVASEQAK